MECVGERGKGENGREKGKGGDGKREEREGWDW